MRRMYSENQIAKAKKNIANLVDADGNPRFVEGDGEIAVPAQIEGLNITYNKWSLSGSHLMIVVAGNVADGTVLANDAFTLYTLPKYISDKIYPVFANTRIEVKTGSFFADNWGKQDATFSLRKLDAPALGVGINLSSGLTLTADRSFRIQFDLLIDAEQAGE